ncbi:MULTISPECIES: hypothetical protein [unclassified Brucella]|uniref:hypothetical protein n=1 Tax=unclassified Brucella TaxID=2632610 RepID=UPI000972D512|nr:MULTISPECIES: hypothetical protein [unclassified Brucella]APY14439.1 hypothetical protein BKD02_09360 [Brucella sp. 09RB8910]
MQFKNLYSPYICSLHSIRRQIVSKFIYASILSLSFLTLSPLSATAGWQDELKKAGKKIEQVKKSISNPQGPEAKKMLGSDARRFLQDPQHEIDRFCNSAAGRAQGLLQGVASVFNPQPTECDEGFFPSPSASK